MKSLTKRKLLLKTAFILMLLMIPVSSVPSDQTEAGNQSPILSMSEGTSSILPNEKYGKLPFSFEPNRGQTDRKVRFLARGPGYTLFLTDTEAVLNLKRESVQKGEESASGLRQRRATRSNEHVSILRMEPVGANSNPKIEGLDALPGRSNYFIGKDPEKWRTNIPQYAKVRYKEIYPGIDLVFYGNPRKLEHDFVVKPGAKPESIRLAFAGADDLEISAKGDLVVQVGGGKVSFQKPRIYQEVDGREITIPGRYLLLKPEPGNRKVETRSIGFQVASYDTWKPLVIDPVLSYSTYLGGELGLDSGSAIAVYVNTANNHRYAYVTGNTSSIDFPTTLGAFDNDYNDTGFAPDVFVTKVDNWASSVIYSTFLGGERSDAGWAIAVDDTGSAYIAGSTSSDNFPTTPGAYKTVRSSGDSFVAKLSPAGDALVYSTFFGGDGSDDIDGIALDGLGKAYLVGETASSFSSINTAGAVVLDNSLGGTRDIFIAELNSGGNALGYFTYLGGSSFDDARNGNIALDNAGVLHIVGRTGSTDFPTTAGAYDTSFAGVVDIVAVKVKPDGSPLQYATYFGGSGTEFPGGMALDSRGNIFVAGETFSTDFPTTPGAYDPTPDSIDAFVAKINPGGAGTVDLIYSTFLGGSGADRARDIAVGKDGLANVTGDTQSTDFPTTPDALKAALANDQDIFMTKLNKDGTDLLFSTVFGGENPVSGQFEFGKAIAVDDLCDVYVAGDVSTSDFPTTSGVFQPETFDLADAFVTKISIGCFTANIEAFVTRFYQQCLNRTPDPGGLAYWVDSLLDGTLTGADVAWGFVFSQEFIDLDTTNEEYLTVLYSAFFDRDPDPGGYEYWLSQLDSGVSREDVLDGFISAQEFIDLCDSYGIIAFRTDTRALVEAFVTRFYQQCLNRTPDPGGLAYWVDSLLDGSLTGADVAYGFVFSQEFLDLNTTDDEYLAVLYRAFFDRQPDPGGFAYWLDQIANGASREDVLNGFIFAQEFVDLCADYGITPF